MRNLLEYLVDDFRFIAKGKFKAPPKFTSIVLCVILNTAIRFGAMYLAVRVFLTAVNQGSF